MKMKNLFNKYKEFINANRTLRPDISIINLPQKQNRFQYVGAQYCNGRIYGIVNSAETMLVYDIHKNEFSFIGNFSDNDFKWTGGCIYHGSIYMFPRAEQTLLSYNPDAKTFSEIESSVVFENEHHYGGVCTDEGFLYQPPRNSNHILKWDIKSKKSSKINIDTNKVFRYCGSVLHPNGYIYFIPEKEGRIIKMNIANEKIEYIGDAIDGFAFDCSILPDGNIYGFRTDKGILKIDTQNDEVFILHDDIYIGAYGTKTGINGMIYSLPGYTNIMWEYDYINNSLKKIYSVNEINNVYYAGGAVDLSGNIYAVPVFADNILKIGFGRDVRIEKDIYNHFFKDFY